MLVYMFSWLPAADEGEEDEEDEGGGDCVGVVHMATSGPSLR